MNEPPQKGVNSAHIFLQEPVFSLLNNYNFQELWDDGTPNQAIRQTLHVVDRSGKTPRVRLRLKAFYELPKRLGLIVPEAFQMSKIVQEIERQSLPQGWSDFGENSEWDADAGKSVSLLFAFHLHPGESSHDWTERILTARPLFDGLAAAGFDVRPDLELFLREAR